MIQKKKEDYMYNEGSGRPYEMNSRTGKYGESRNDAERNTPTVIHLGDLNGQTYDKGMPKNFMTKRGRVLVSFTKYWTSDELQSAEREDAFDIE